MVKNGWVRGWLDMRGCARVRTYVLACTRARHACVACARVACPPTTQSLVVQKPLPTLAFQVAPSREFGSLDDPLRLIPRSSTVRPSRSRNHSPSNLSSPRTHCGGALGTTTYPPAVVTSTRGRAPGASFGRFGRTQRKYAAPTSKTLDTATSTMNIVSIFHVPSPYFRPSSVAKVSTTHVATAANRQSHPTALSMLKVLKHRATQCLKQEDMLLLHQVWGRDRVCGYAIVPLLAIV